MPTPETKRLLVRCEALVKQAEQQAKPNERLNALIARLYRLAGRRVSS